MKRLLIVLLLCPSFLLSSWDLAGGFEGQFDVSLTGSVTLSLLPEEVASEGQWQVVSEQDGDGDWLVSPTAWLRSGETADEVIPGRHALVFRAPAGWRR